MLLESPDKHIANCKARLDQITISVLIFRICQQLVSKEDQLPGLQDNLMAETLLGTS